MIAARLGLVIALGVFATPLTAAQPQTDAGRIADQAIKQRFGTESTTATRAAPDLELPKVAPSPGRAGELAPQSLAAAQTPTSPQQREQMTLGAPARTQAPTRGGDSGGVLNHWLVRTAGALTLVIGLILLCKKLFVRLSQGTGGVASQFGAGGRAPSGVLEILGRYPVSRGHTLVLLKVDRRVLLLGHSSGGFTTLSEITDSEEVASLLVKTRDEEGETMTARFNALLRGMERDPSTIDAEPRRGILSARTREEVPEITTRRAGLSAAASDLAKRLEVIRNGGKGIKA